MIDIAGLICGWAVITIGLTSINYSFYTDNKGKLAINALDLAVSLTAVAEGIFIIILT